MAALTRGKRLVLLSLGLEKWKLDTDKNEGKNNLKILDLDVIIACDWKIDQSSLRLRNAVDLDRSI